MERRRVPVKPGKVLARKYRVEEVLGVGGVGVVVAATHVRLGKRVALKFLQPEAAADPETVHRFSREARAAGRLKSEHVARILDVETIDDRTTYIVMEYLEGTDAAAILRRYGALPVPVAVDYVIQALDALAEAHSVGIVHRDVKPSNLFVTMRADGSAWVKVLDFGISKMRPIAGDMTLTRTHSVIGSPAYMSPEHMRDSRLVDARSDIWSLGIILYQLVSGQLPFGDQAFSALVVKVVMDPVPPLLSPMPLPVGFESVVRRCLRKDPDLRFQSAAELASALAPFAPASALPIVERIAHLRGAEPSTSSLELAATLPGDSATQIAEAPPLAGQITTRTSVGERGADATAMPPAPQPIGADPTPRSTRAGDHRPPIATWTAAGAAAIAAIVLLSGLFARSAGRAEEPRLDGPTIGAAPSRPAPAPRSAPPSTPTPPETTAPATAAPAQPAQARTAAPPRDTARREPSTAPTKTSPVIRSRRAHRPPAPDGCGYAGTSLDERGNLQVRFRRNCPPAAGPDPSVPSPPIPGDRSYLHRP